jgi:uncharacterized RDD family membrane protein YckC
MSELGVAVTEVVTGEAVVLEVPCASFPSRLLALVLDLLIQLVMFAALFSVLGVASLNGSLNGASASAVAVVLIVAVVVGYPVIWETLTRGRSPGKFALGLRVVSDDGGPERFRQALVRGLAAAVEIWMLLGCPALICSLLSARGKRLGDLFAGTFVIQQRLPTRRGAAPPAAMTPELAHWAASLEMSRLSEQTAATARRYLARLPELTPDARAELGERITAAVRSQVSPPPPPGMPVPVFLSAVLAERHNREHARLAGVAAPGYAAAPGDGAQAQSTPAPGPAPASTAPASTAPPAGVPAPAVPGGQPGVGEQLQPDEPRAPNTGGFVPPA